MPSPSPAHPSYIIPGLIGKFLGYSKRLAFKRSVAVADVRRCISGVRESMVGRVSHMSHGGVQVSRLLSQLLISSSSYPIIYWYLYVLW